MSLKLNERYPGRFNNPSADYPQGSFKNRTSPTAKDGSYLEQDWANDKEGFFQSLISVAGVVPSGAADKVGASQYYDALLTVLYAAARKTPVLNDTGTAGAYAAANTPPLTALPATGYMQRVKIVNPNVGASTYAPDGLAAKPVYGLGLQPLQGGELVTGVAVLMYLVQAGVNGGNGAWIVIEALGGATQIAQGTKSQHAIQLSQMAAVVGGTRNARMSIAAASATATFLADEVAVKTALGGSAWLLSGFNKTINLATVGAGGMDVGTAPTSGYVAIYAIYNPLTSVSALLATNATSAVQAEVYGGANMPAGYTASALVSVTPTDAAKLFKIMVQSDRHIAIAGVTVISSSSLSTTPVAINCASAIPFNAKTVDISWAVTQTSAGQPTGMGVSSTSGGLGFISIFSVSTSGTSSQTTAALMAISVPQTMYMSAQTANPGTYASGITGYTF